MGASLAREFNRVMRMVRLSHAGVFFMAVSCYGQWGLIASDAAQVSPSEGHRFLEMICPGHVSGAGCAVCPVETAFKGKTTETWELRTITFGHFMAPTSEDALVSGFGCEPHVALFSGAFLFTKKGTSWRKVRYSPGENADDCKKLTGSDGRDLLICEASDGHFDGPDWFLYLMDAGHPRWETLRDSFGREYFFDVTDTLATCAKLPDGDVLSGNIESVSFMPAPARHAVRILVTARLGKAAIPDKLMEICPVLQGALRIATVRRRYEFLFDGQRVAPAPSNPPIENTNAVAPRTSYTAVK